MYLLLDSYTPPKKRKAASAIDPHTPVLPHHAVPGVICDISYLPHSLVVLFCAVGMPKWGSAVVGRFSGTHMTLVYLILLSPNEKIIQ
jgi:hypothetical protein